MAAAGSALLNPPLASFEDVLPNTAFYQAYNATRGQIAKIVYNAITEPTTGCAGPTGVPGP